MGRESAAFLAGPHGRVRTENLLSGGARRWAPTGDGQPTMVAVSMIWSATTRIGRERFMANLRIS